MISPLWVHLLNLLIFQQPIYHEAPQASTCVKGLQHWLMYAQIQRACSGPGKFIDNDVSNKHYPAIELEQSLPPSFDAAGRRRRNDSCPDPPSYAFSTQTLALKHNDTSSQNWPSCALCPNHTAV